MSTIEVIAYSFFVGYYSGIFVVILIEGFTK